MGTFSPETCLELVATLTRQQVDREYLYFGGTDQLATKDKRFKIREYLVNLRDCQSLVAAVSEYTAATAGVVDQSKTSLSEVYSYTSQTLPPTGDVLPSNVLPSNVLPNNVLPPSSPADPQLQALHSLCQEINSNVLTMKVEFADWIGQRNGGGCYDAVDMDLSDPGEDMELSDCDNTVHSYLATSTLLPSNHTELTVQSAAHPPKHIERDTPRGGRGTTAPPRGNSMRGGGAFNNRPSNGGQHTSYPGRGGVRGGGGGGGGGGSWSRDSVPSQRSRANNTRGSRFSTRGGGGLSRPSGGMQKRDFGVRGLGNKEEIPHDLKPVDWDNVALEKIHKVFYNENSATASRPKEDIDKWRESHQLVVREDCPNPILQFDEVSFPNAIRHVIRQNGFEQPTPIQAQGWPIALQGRDMIGIAQTGSGKTLGFTLPGLIHINAQPPGNENGPIALCLCPTRELAQQVMGVCEEFSRAMRIRAVCLYGGSSKYQQTRQLAEGVEFAIATPGRLIDLLNTGRVSLRRCSYLVLDEADRMLDMGFEPQITAIISQIRPDRQTLMWSATWPDEVQELAANFLKDPLQITIGSEKLVANHAIKQVVQVIEGFEKFDKLKLLLQEISDQGQDNKTLVFTDTKRMADDIAAELKSHSWPVESMHGDKRQEERERILHDFKKGYISILVATDVASRGIDISDITNVINFDYPNTSEDYIHRIGRTARASRKGTAYTFITPNDSRNIDDLVEVLKEANQEVPHALMMMRECFGGSKPEKKAWVPKSAKRRAEAQTREAENKRLAQSDTDKPLYTWDEDAGKEDSDSDVEVRKRQNCPETDDDWAALYGDMGNEIKKEVTDIPDIE